MLKTIRNTAFTLAVVLLTAYGLAWQRQASRAHQSLRANQPIVAAERLGVAKPDFPLNLSFSQPNLRLGTTQKVTIQTVPEAQLDIVSQYPDGSTNNGQTLRAQADSAGYYRLTFKVDDFRQLGIIRLSVLANSGTKTTETIGQFSVISWQTTEGGENSLYRYPLAP